jgi:hypothetical protein
MDDARHGHGVRRYWKGHYFSSLPDEALDAFVLPGTPDGQVSGCPPRRCRTTAARSLRYRTPTARQPTATRRSNSSRPRAGPTPPRMGAARRYAATLEPFATGIYDNPMSDDGAAGVARASPPAKLARLRALKAAHDPGNVFHLNQNIEPA